MKIKILVLSFVLLLIASLPAVATDILDGAGTSCDTKYLVWSSANTRWECTPVAAGTITTVTVSANTTSDQNLMNLTIPAGQFNVVGRYSIIKAAGTYTTPGAQTPTLTFKVKLCTVSGCASGTVITAATWTTAATTPSSTTIPWALDVTMGTVTTGASGTIEAHGLSYAVLGTTATATLSTTATGDIREANNVAPSSAVDLTAQLFLQFTIAFSTGSASNSCTQRHGFITFVN